MIELAAGDLNADGVSVQLGDVQVRTPGLLGAVRLYETTAQDSRGESLDSASLTAALAAEDMSLDWVLEFTELEDVGAPAGVQTRGTPAGQPAMEIEVRAPGDGYGQVLLATDENGLASWHFPSESDAESRTHRDAATVTYLVPMARQPAAEPTQTRGALGWLGRKVLRVLSFPLISKAIGRVGEHFVARWEAARRPHLLREFGRDNYQDVAAAPLSAERLQALGDGRALLFIHGTFSRAHTAFGSLPAPFVDQLHQHYQGRVFAFDHPTVSVDPVQNAAWLVEQLPVGCPYEFDVICHSRGGLVTRVLAEKQSLLPLAERQLRINRVVFVASPNDGTPLVEADYMGECVDTYTNVLSLLPDNLFTDSLEVIIALVKQLSVATLAGLDGLQAMRKGGDFFNRLVAGDSASDYYAIAADFEPVDPSLKQFVADRLMDKVFAESNDLVVPTESVFRANGTAGFPIPNDRCRVLPAAAGVHHGGFFNHPDTLNALSNWLLK